MSESAALLREARHWQTLTHTHTHTHTVTNSKYLEAEEVTLRSW